MSLDKVTSVLHQFRLLGADPGHRPRVLGLRVPRHHPRHRDPVRHLRSRRGDGQRRERGSRGRPLSDDASADRRRRGQPDRLPDGQPVHQRGLYRPSRLEGDGRAHRLFGGDRRDGDRAVLVRHHLGDAGADPGGRDLADPALHRHADRRAGVPDHAERACAGDRAGADAASRGLGQDADRRRARRRRHHCGRRRLRQDGECRACSITGSR